jgi:YD repeat-containing protein
VTSYGYTGNSLLPNSIQLPTPNRPAIQIARNSSGLPTTINDPAVVGASATQISYYPSSNLPEQVLDGAQRPTNFYYTATNNLQTLRRQHNGANVDINYGYDSHDNLNTIEDPLNHTWTIGHDSLGRITSATDPTGVQSSCTYDQYGNVSTATVPGATIPGQTYSIKYSYDALHRLTGITTPTGSTTYQYDPVTQWVDTATQKDTSGNTLETVSYNYNNSTGQVTGVTNTLAQPGSSNSTPVTTTYGYNSYGNVSSVTPSGGQPLNLNYNAAGQLLGTSETDSGPAVGPTILASNASSGVWTNQNSQTMSWGAPESSLPITGFSYAEDGSAGTTVNATGSSLAWNNINDGQHLFAMRAVDSAGNWSPQSVFNLWIDTTPPSVTNVTVTPNPIPQGSVTVTITANISDAGSGLSGTPQIRWYVGSSSPQNWGSYASMTGSGSQWSSSFVEPGTGQTLYYQIQSQDAVGNSGVYSGSMNISGPSGTDGPLMPPLALALLALLFLGVGNWLVNRKVKPESLAK